MSKESKLIKLLGEDVIKELLPETSPPDVPKDADTIKQGVTDLTLLDVGRQTQEVVGLSSAMLTNNNKLTVADSPEVAALKKKWAQFVMEKQKLDSTLEEKYNLLSVESENLKGFGVIIVRQASSSLNEFAKKFMPKEWDEDLSPLALYDLVGEALNTISLKELIDWVSSVSETYKRVHEFEDSVLNDSLSLLIQYFQGIATAYGGSKADVFSSADFVPKIIAISRTTGSIMKNAAIRRLGREKNGLTS
jgi:hypothetical protein